MKIKPKDLKVNSPIVLHFDDQNKIAEFALSINSIINGKIKLKYEILGLLSNKYVVLFYLQRDIEFQYLRREFMELINNSELNPT